MKYFKIFTVLLGLLALASCSNKDDAPKINTASGVAVSMAEGEITFKENRGIMQIPVKVTGEANGYVQVTCRVEEVGANPAMEDVHYLMTAYSINIATGDKEGYFELRLVDDRVENDPRTFIVTLESSEGAQISGTTQTYVEILDNDQVPYERMGGEWLLLINGGVQGTVRFNDADPGTLGYGEYYSVTDLVKDISLTADFAWDDANHVATITFKFGEKFVNIDGTEYKGFLCYVSPDYMDIITSGEYVFKWYADQDPDNIVLESGIDGVASFWILYYNANNQLSIFNNRQDVTGFMSDF